MSKYGKITIIGVGLIGGSIGLAIKNRKLAREVVGVGHRRVSIDKAIRLKTIDKGTLDLKSGVKDADIVILATPVLNIPKLAKKIARFSKKGSILTDVGSTKSYIARRIGDNLAGGAHFVGAHPMAGSEMRGTEKARMDIFRNSICILTPTGNIDKESLIKIKRLWKALGAKVIVLSPQAHDEAVAEISHLPHVLAFTLVNSIEDKSMRFASSGFFDTTRIASSDAGIWRDIVITNGEEILKSIRKFKNELSILERAVRKKDSRKLLAIFTKAKKKRDSGYNLKFKIKR